VIVIVRVDHRQPLNGGAPVFRQFRVLRDEAEEVIGQVLRAQPSVDLDAPAVREEKEAVVREVAVRELVRRAHRDRHVVRMHAPARDVLGAAESP
jgi:hypothetical protein